MKEDVDGEEKAPVLPRKCYNLTNRILGSKFIMSVYCHTSIFLTICLTSAVACGFSDDRPFRYISLHDLDQSSSLTEK